MSASLTIKLKMLRYSILLLSLVSNVLFGAQNKNDDVKELQAAESSQQDKNAENLIEWGDWAVQNNEDVEYGVGIQGTIESELSRLDKSNLLDNADGVASKKTSSQTVSRMTKKPKDIKRMMKELEIMEAEVKQEINNDTEF